MKDKLIIKFLLFVINNERLYKIFTQYKWFNDLMYEQAQKIIGNR